MERDSDDLIRYNLPSVISIHALRMERDQMMVLWRHRELNFYPRAPHGARLFGKLGISNIFIDFYPRAPHGARPDDPFYRADPARISIHALRMERDRRGGGNFGQSKKFLSTRSAWSATSALWGAMDL